MMWRWLFKKPWRWKTLLALLITVNLVPFVPYKPICTHDTTQEMWLEGEMTEPFLTAFKEAEQLGFLPNPNSFPHEMWFWYLSFDQKIYLRLGFFGEGWLPGGTSERIWFATDAAVQAMIKPEGRGPKTKAWIEENNWSPPARLLELAQIQDGNGFIYDWLGDCQIVALAAFGHEVSEENIHLEPFGG